ncbi:adenylate kinase family enzyme [Nakamurella sp. UYEF19]|uniref:ATP-binding protein n=1 Tax=Nakamurella sp. UYEF19 TaxID=1756392 RepID=UPI00339410F6
MAPQIVNGAHDEWMGELIVVTGPPGAGKTTVSQILSGLFDLSAHIAGDEFFGFIDQGYLAPWTNIAHRQNEIVIEAAAAGRLAAGGYTVIYDGVVRPWFLDAFGRATGLGRLLYLILLPPEHMCLDRVASRVGHGFTDLDAASHMYADFAQADVDSRHVITSVANADLQAAHLFELVRSQSVVSLVEQSQR